MATLTERQRAVLLGKNFYTVSTIGKDGGPRATTIWGDLEGDDVVLNAQHARAWLANLRRDSRVAVTVHDAVDPYNQVSLRGRAVEITEEGGQAGIDHLSAKYTGNPVYATPAGDRRFRVRVVIEHARSWGD